MGEKGATPQHTQQEKAAAEQGAASRAPGHQALDSEKRRESVRRYRYAILDPRPAGKEQNEAIFASGPVWGIEVTVPALAERCVVNIDPQHSGGDAGRAAIEEALSIELFPPEGVTLATIRADLDSIGAMAVLSLRAQGVSFEKETLRRIRRIAEADTFARGEWPGPRPLPSREHPWPEYDSEGDTEGAQSLAAIAAAVSDFRVPIEERVALMERWLISGEEPPAYRDKVQRERQEMIDALERGDIAIRKEAEGKIAVVESTHRAAMALGYSVAPVVVALNPAFRFQGGEPIRKFTIAQYREGYVNLRAVIEELNELEPGWGGSAAIAGSPQGVSSQLSVEQVVEIVRKHLM